VSSGPLPRDTAASSEPEPLHTGHQFVKYKRAAAQIKIPVMNARKHETPINPAVVTRPPALPCRRVELRWQLSDKPRASFYHCWVEAISQRGGSSQAGFIACAAYDQVSFRCSSEAGPAPRG
jgi:hypothetical protein